MLKIENHCVDCGIHCLGDICPNRRVEVHYCDKCGCELEEIYEVEGEELCEDCLKERFRKE